MHEMWEKTGVKIIVADTDNFEIPKTAKESLRPEDLAFWHNNPPDCIVLATASLRKAYFVYLAMNDFNFQSKPEFLGDQLAWLEEASLSMHPLEFQRLIEANIRNGDGKLEQGNMLFLGFCHGVAVCVDPQNGETADNTDPTKQSENKILSLQEKPIYRDLDVIFVASDTVGLVDDQSLGKPRNLPDFPKQDTEESEDEYQERLKAFDIWFVLRYYTHFGIEESFETWFAQYDHSLEVAKKATEEKLNKIEDSSQIHDVHINSLLMIRGDKQESVETTLNFILDLRYQLKLITEVVGAAGLLIYLESGSGGLTQRKVFENYPLDDQELRGLIIDQKLLDFLLSVSGEELKSYYLLIHLMGAPVWAYPVMAELGSEAN